MSNTKQLISKLILLLMLLFIAVSFCACGELNSIIISHEDGSIEESVTISLDANAVINSGYNVVELKRDIREDAINDKCLPKI